MIEAHVANGTISARGVTITHRTPALALCRALVAAGCEDSPMTVYRKGVPAMLISSIHSAATRTVIENEKVGPRFAKWSPFVGIAVGAPDSL
jgi:hypothetical protein